VPGQWPLTATRYLAIANAAAGNTAEAHRIAQATLERAEASKAAHEESLALDLLAGLAILAGGPPEAGLVQRRDLLLRRLGVVETPVYPPIPRALSTDC
jgi:hypothetical protein